MELVIDRKLEQQRKWVSYGTTAISHVLLLLLLWFSMLKENDPPMDQGGGGMELSMALGEADMGGPSEIPVAEPTPVEATPEPIVEEQEVVTQDVEEVAVAAKKTETPKKPEVKKPTETKITPPVEKPRVADQRSMFKKSTTAAAQGGSGDGGVPGNEGRPDGVEGGSPDGNGIGNGDGGSGGGTGGGNGTGHGPGNGPGWSLAGRKLVQTPKIIDNSKEEGNVVVLIVVDRSGRVIRAEPGQKGSTTLSSVLFAKAKQGALDTQFSPRTDGPDEQFGTMTFKFRLVK